MESFRKRVERAMIAALLLTLALAVIAAISSCAPKAIPVDPIAPKAVRVREAAEATDRATRKVGESAKHTRSRTEETREAVGRGTMDADALAKAGTATKEQLEENARRWREAWDSALLAVQDATRLTNDTKELAASSERSVNESTTLEMAAVKTDKNTVDLTRTIDKQAGDVALGKSVKTIFWIALAVGGVILLVWAFVRLAPIIIKAAKPL